MLEETIAKMPVLLYLLASLDLDFRDSLLRLIASTLARDNTSVDTNKDITKYATKEDPTKYTEGII